MSKSGGRSRRAGEMLAAQGYTRLINVDGGYMEWAEARLPTSQENGEGVSYESLKARA